MVYIGIARAWALIFLGVGLLFLLAPHQVAVGLTSLANAMGLKGIIEAPTGNVWYILALSLMTAVTGLAWESSRRPADASSFRLLLSAKLVSTAGFAVLAFQLAPAWFVCAAGDGFVALTLWLARLASGPGRGFARIYSDHAPAYEVWFGKVNIGPDQALWFRYSLLDGAVQEASTWAVFFDGNHITAGKDRHRLRDLAPPNVPILPAGETSRFSGKIQVFHLGSNHLDGANALGTAGPISWDLAFCDSGKRFVHVPWGIRLLGLAKSVLETPFMDVRFRGTIRVGGQEVTIDEAPGMIGHLHGKRAAYDWAWGHCNAFDGRSDVVFEGLSARILLAGRPSVPLSSFVLWVGETCYRFSSTLRIASSRSQHGEGRWTFEATADGITLKGEATAPDLDRVAVLTYVDTDGSNQWCHNSKLATLRLRLKDPVREIDQEFIATRTAAFELVSRIPPARTVTL